MAERLEAELDQRGRREWFRHPARRALELSATDRARDLDEAWRISGAGILTGRVRRVLARALAMARKEAEGADRRLFHILQNRELISSAESFAAGNVPDSNIFSPRRRNAFRESAARALRMPEKDWPVKRRRSGTPTDRGGCATRRELRRHRDRAAKDLDLEPFFIAPRATLEAIAADEPAPACCLFRGNSSCSESQRSEVRDQRSADQPWPARRAQALILELRSTSPSLNHQPPHGCSDWLGLIEPPRRLPLTAADVLNVVMHHDLNGVVPDGSLGSILIPIYPSESWRACECERYLCFHTTVFSAVRKMPSVGLSNK